MLSWFLPSEHERTCFGGLIKRKITSSGFHVIYGASVQSNRLTLLDRIFRIEYWKRFTVLDISKKGKGFCYPKSVFFGICGKAGLLIGGSVEAGKLCPERVKTREKVAVFGNKGVIIRFLFVDTLLRAKIGWVGEATTESSRVESCAFCPYIPLHRRWRLGFVVDYLQKKKNNSDEQHRRVAPTIFEFKTSYIVEGQTAVKSVENWIFHQRYSTSETQIESPEGYRGQLN